LAKYHLEQVSHMHVMKGIFNYPYIITQEKY